MKTIDENTIQSYQNHIYTQEKSQNTIDKYIRDIRTFTAWLETQEVPKAARYRWDTGFDFAPEPEGK